MSEKEKQILETFGELIPKLSESNKNYLLGLGEGMAIAARAEMKRKKRCRCSSKEKNKNGAVGKRNSK